MTLLGMLYFDVDNSSSYHTNNRKNNFLVSGGIPTYGVNESFGWPEKKFSTNVSKWSTKSCLSLHYSGYNSCCVLMEKKSFKFKTENNLKWKLTENVNFPTKVCLGNIYNGFGATEFREVSLKGNVYNFLVDYNAVNKSDILNSHKYLWLRII